jgi:hypothetical protein
MQQAFQHNTADQLASTQFTGCFFAVSCIYWKPCNPETPFLPPERFIPPRNIEVMVFRASADFHAWLLPLSPECRKGNEPSTLLLYADY